MLKILELYGEPNPLNNNSNRTSDYQSRDLYGNILTSTTSRYNDWNRREYTERVDRDYVNARFVPILILALSKKGEAKKLLVFFDIYYFKCFNCRQVVEVGRVVNVKFYFWYCF